jgi:hypothetical protein
MSIPYGNVRTLKKFPTILIFLHFHVGGRSAMQNELRKEAEMMCDGDVTKVTNGLKTDVVVN